MLALCLILREQGIWSLPPWLTHSRAAGFLPVHLTHGSELSHPNPDLHKLHCSMSRSPTSILHHHFLVCPSANTTYLFTHWVGPITGQTKAVVMCCPAYGKVHINDPLLLNRKSSLCGVSGFPLKKYVTMTICLTLNSRWYENQCALEASLNKTSFPFIGWVQMCLSTWVWK